MNCRFVKSCLNNDRIKRYEELADFSSASIQLDLEFVVSKKDETERFNKQHTARIKCTSKFSTFKRSFVEGLVNRASVIGRGYYRSGS